MARIRTVKPEFWTSEQVVECSRDARLLFIGLWNFCDDGGAHPANPRAIKMRVFPADEDITSETIRRLIAELVANRLLVIYEAQGIEYLKVTGWDRHQKIEKPSFRYPKITDPGVISRSQSPTDRRPIDDDLPPEGKEGRGSGKDGTDDEKMRAREPQLLDQAIEIIGAFDRKRAAIFGANRARPWPNAKDRPMAQRWLEAGADLALCEAVFDARFRKQLAKGDEPSDTLAHMDQSVAQAIAARNRPMPAVADRPQPASQPQPAKSKNVAAGSAEDIAQLRAMGLEP